MSNTVMGCCIIALGCFVLWMFILQLREKIRFSEKHSGKATAWLYSTKRVEAVYTRDHGVFRHAIDAKYEYIAEGKKYIRAHRFFDATYSSVPRKATVVYQKTHPDRAYLESFSGPVKTTPLDALSKPHFDTLLVHYGIISTLLIAFGVYALVR